ncbi:hypothetical protein PCL_09907 [Purpureocillium lilacinum]|uniref:Uncharacterized protein n=1 Tax=Purpureocillium lilacinum TaxID=33203 RepID=A0A2U3EEI8_PURLI|nr:hypothetical protein Purlil1_1067 [Purpureocillium lilacinum]PWI72892.1 hypothetical protein PCL_09907 [Purpureocillium lilacinum]
MGDDDPKWVKERPHFDVGGEAADAATIAVSHSDDFCNPSNQQDRREHDDRQHGNRRHDDAAAEWFLCCLYKTHSAPPSRAYVIEQAGEYLCSEPSLSHQPSIVARFRRSAMPPRRKTPPPHESAAYALGLALAMDVAPTTARPRPFLVSDHLHVLSPPLTHAMTLLRVRNSFFVLYVRAFTCKGPLPLAPSHRADAASLLLGALLLGIIYSCIVSHDSASTTGKIELLSHGPCIGLAGVQMPPSRVAGMAGLIRSAGPQRGAVAAICRGPTCSQATHASITGIVDDLSLGTLLSFSSGCPDYVTIAVLSSEADRCWFKPSMHAQTMYSSH